MIYFVSDVHLGLSDGDAAGREDRFVRFLKEIPRDRTEAVYLLGDVWDFWFEYRDLIPCVGARVIAEIISLLDDGVEVLFCPGNHDLWSFSFLESLGVKKISQPYFFETGGMTVCVGHGDALGKVPFAVRLMTAVFHNRAAQRAFSVIHPWLAYRLGNGWSRSNRSKHASYRFQGESEPLYAYASELSERRRVDLFVFGHFHDSVDMTLPGGARFVVLNDWMKGGMPHVALDGGTLTVVP